MLRAFTYMSFRFLFPLNEVLKMPNFCAIYHKSCSASSGSVAVALCLTMGTLRWGWRGFSSFAIFDV